MQRADELAAWVVALALFGCAGAPASQGAGLARPLAPPSAEVTPGPAPEASAAPTSERSASSEAAVPARPPAAPSAEPTPPPSRLDGVVPTAKDSERSTSELPSLWHGGVPFVETMIDGRGPYRLLLDSGSTFLVLDERVVTALELPRQSLQPDGTSVSIDAGAGHAELREKAWVHEMEAGPFHVRDVGALVMDLRSLEDAAGMRVDGVLPVTALQQGLLTLDFAHQSIRWAPGKLPTNGGDVLELLDGDYRPVISARVVGHECPVLIDTGFQGFLALPAVMENALQFRASPVALGLSQTAAGIHERRAGRLTGTVLFGTHRLRDPVVDLSPRSCAAVGSGLLQTFRVTFDMAQRRVRLDRDKKDDIVSPSIRGTGLTFELEDDAWRVVYVVKGSPASTSGLRIGDRVDRIDDQPVETLDCWFDDASGAAFIDVRVLGPQAPRVVRLPVATLLE